MQLPGRLSQTTLGDLLGAAFRERITGTLELEEVTGPAAGRRHAIFLEDGLVVRIDTELGARIGQILVEQGSLPSARLRRLLWQRRADEEGPVGRWLVAGGHIEPDSLTLALERQIEARLEALFALRDARLYFRVPRPRDRRKDAPAPLRPAEFLPGRPRARETLRARGGGRAQTRRADPARGPSLSVLQLPESAGAAEVREAFRRLASRYHPDRHPGASHEEKREMLRKFAELSHAYHVLIA
ncbi:MAG: J domain-containing protein [Polyangiaceae bacterium]|nr:J domain-containing protein [Polyangiaceae bacterium]